MQLLGCMLQKYLFVVTKGLQYKREKASRRNLSFVLKSFLKKKLESYGAQVAVNQKAILRLEIELTRLLGLKLNNEEVVIAFVKQEVVATVDKCGEQFLLTVRV